MDIYALSEFILGCQISDIDELVILAPCWSPQSAGLKYADKITDKTCEIWKCRESGKKFTYIVSGVGASAGADIIRALEVTACRQILLCGSAGALEPQIKIGDLAVPDWTVCGEGASRYHQKDLAKDVFGSKIEVDQKLQKRVLTAAKEASSRIGISCYTGTAISVESIFSEFGYVEDFISKGYKFIDMEASACLSAARIAGIPMAIVFCISDNVIRGESLVTVSNQKTGYRKEIRLKIMPQIIRTLLECEVLK